MAIISISRQVAALGDEVCIKVSEKMGYRFISRTYIEEKLMKMGFDEKKMLKYDERKPGFFASLSKDRDEYLAHLQLALLEEAETNNVVIIGRGAFATFAGIPNHLSFRVVADNKIRVDRLMAEKNWTERQARNRIDESDTNREGFHKAFYNVNVEDSTNYNMVINTGIYNEERASNIIVAAVKAAVSQEDEKNGMDQILRMKTAQSFVNKLLFEYKVKVDFLHASIDGNTMVLQGVADSVGIVEQVISIARREVKDYEIRSAISVIHDFKQF